jgi:biotin transporter BioY
VIPLVVLVLARARARARALGKCVMVSRGVFLFYILRVVPVSLFRRDCLSRPSRVFWYHALAAWLVGLLWVYTPGWIRLGSSIHVVLFIYIQVVFSIAAAVRSYIPCTL